MHLKVFGMRPEEASGAPVCVFGSPWGVGGLPHLLWLNAGPECLKMLFALRYLKALFQQQVQKSVACLLIEIKIVAVLSFIYIFQYL